MMRVTLEIVAKTLFGASLTSDQSTEVGRAMDVVTEFYTQPLPALFPVLARVPTPLNRRFRRAVERLDEIIFEVIRARRSHPSSAPPTAATSSAPPTAATGGTDLLSMLLEARDDDGGRMSDRQLRDEIMTLFLAGHETTAIALTFTWYLLAKHPAVRARLDEELENVLGDRLPTTADLPRLRFVDHVITESMRLYPPAWSMGREATRDCELAGYHVPSGMQVWFSQWVVQRDPRWFSEPERFDPSRWEGDLAKRIPRYAYFPFGGGPRLCIGNTFAMMEAVLIVATLARRTRVEVSPTYREELLPAVTLRPRRGLPMIVRRVEGAGPA